MGWLETRGRLSGTQSMGCVCLGGPGAVLVSRRAELNHCLLILRVARSDSEHDPLGREQLREC